MRFITYLHAGQERCGVVHGDSVHALEPGVRLLDLLGDDGERLHDAGGHALADPASVEALDGLVLLPPIPQPPTIRDFLTFEKHLEGSMRVLEPDATVPPEFFQQPFFYFTNPYAAVGTDADVPIAPGSNLFDFELEACAVIGRAGRNLTPEQAGAHIVGYLIMNDWSARDLQAGESAIPLGPVKAKDTATTLGPCLVTADELEPHRSGTAFDLAMTATLNGRTIGTDRMTSMYWSFEELVAYASRGTTVGPGDHLGSGTSGMGCLLEGWGRHGFDFSPALAPGDLVELTIEQLGTIRNAVIEAEPVHPLRHPETS